MDTYWDHWGETGFDPPLDIASDFYPALGTYSVADPAAVAQHFAWLREAGMGVIVSSWWGQRSREDRAVPLLLDIAEQYDIQVAFHMEPYGGRTEASFPYDVRYIYRQYGDHPAFFRTTASSRWSPDDRAKGLFYLWSARFPDSDSDAVEPSYWQDALDAIHALPEGGIADILFTGWESGRTVVFEIERGHLGSTQVELSKLVEDEPVLVETFEWGGISDGRNAITVQIPADVLFGATP